MKTRQQPHRKECMLLKKIANNAMSVSFSHRCSSLLAALFVNPLWQYYLFLLIFLRLLPLQTPPVL